jgi:hypothetical protein
MCIFAPERKFRGAFSLRYKLQIIVLMHEMQNSKFKMQN